VPKILEKSGTQDSFADVIKNNDVAKLFMINLEFTHDKENVCLFHVKKITFPGIMARLIMT